MGALTRGQRQTGGQGLFRPEDNLESPYARDALRQLYRRIYRGDVPGCSLMAFEDATGLSLTDDNGLKDDLPPITTFLNRLLALTIAMQSVLFSAFEALLDQRIEGAIAAGVYDLGLETLRAESFRITDARVIYTHPGSGAETLLLTIAERRRNTPLQLIDALDPPYGGQHDPGQDDGRYALAGSRPRIVLRRMDGRTGRGARVLGSHTAHRGGAFAADLEATPPRRNPRVPTANR